MYGQVVHEKIIAAGEKKSGATVHLVDEDYDHGPIVLQRAVDVTVEDTPISLAEKVLRVEHQILPEAVRLFAENKILIQDGKVTILS